MAFYLKIIILTAMLKRNSMEAREGGRSVSRLGVIRVWMYTCTSDFNYAYVYTTFTKHNFYYVNFEKYRRVWTIE